MPYEIEKTFNFSCLHWIWMGTIAGMWRKGFSGLKSVKSKRFKIRLSLTVFFCFQLMPSTRKINALIDFVYREKCMALHIHQCNSQCIFTIAFSSRAKTNLNVLIRCCYCVSWVLLLLLLLFCEAIFREIVGILFGVYTRKWRMACLRQGQFMIYIPNHRFACYL